MSGHIQVSGSTTGVLQQPDLWQAAVDKLDDDLRRVILNASQKRLDVLKNTLSFVEQQKEISLNKRLSCKGRHGEKIILRDVFEKLIRWIVKFKEVGDIAVQADGGAACLVWAGVRFLLQVAVSEVETYQGVFEDIERIAFLVARYAHVEAIYLSHDWVARRDLEDGITKLYAHILTYLAKIKQYLQKPTAKRILKSAFGAPFDAMKLINEQDDQITGVLRIFTAEGLSQVADEAKAIKLLLDDLQQPIQRTASLVMALPDSNTYLTMLRWLSNIDFAQIHRRYQTSRTSGTGAWLLNHNEYLQWRHSSSSSILHLYGSQGTGKSFLASLVVDSLQRSYPAPTSPSNQLSPPPVAYFYCSKLASEPKRADPSEILRSIVRQLTVEDSQKQVLDLILDEYRRQLIISNKSGFAVPQLSIEDCTRVILNVTSSSPISIVIDAIDEVQENNRHLVLDPLKAIVDQSANVVNIFMTSRGEANIMAHIEDCRHANITTTRASFQDVEVLARAAVNTCIGNKQLLNGKVPTTLQDELVQVLSTYSQDMLLCVELQIKRLCKMKLVSDVRSAMKKLDFANLTQLYAEIFSEAFSDSPTVRNIAHRAFKWLLCAQEQLSMTHLLQILPIGVLPLQETMTARDLLDVCAGMIVADSETDLLHFAHVSVQEYLETMEEFEISSAHASAAVTSLMICTEYFNDGSRESGGENHVSLDYSIRFWPHHCQLSHPKYTPSLSTKVCAFVLEDDVGGGITFAFEEWVEYIDKIAAQGTDIRTKSHVVIPSDLSSVVSKPKSALFLASSFGMEYLLDHPGLGRNVEWNQCNHLGANPLYLAARSGYFDVAQRIIAHGGNVNAEGGVWGRPLHAACFEGHGEIVQLLLKNGAEYSHLTRYGDAFDAIVLGANEAVAEEMIKFLTESLKPVDTHELQNKMASAGFLDAFELLRKASKNSGIDDATAVHNAVRRGHLKKLQKYAKEQPGFAYPPDTLAWAAIGGHKNTLEYLISQGVPLEFEGQIGTPIRAASLAGNASSIHLLVENGASIDSGDKLGTALQTASARGDISMTRLLLEHKSEVNKVCGYYGTALCAAAFHGHVEVVKLLLKNGAEMEAYQQHNSRWKNAFEAAIEAGQANVINVFISEGYTINRQIGVFPRGHAPPLSELLEDTVIGPQTGGKHHSSNARSKRRRKRKPTTNTTATISMRERSNFDQVPDFTAASPKIQTGILAPAELAADPKTEELIPKYRNGRRVNGRGILMAAKQGNVGMVQMLISHRDTFAITDKDVGAAMLEAAASGTLETLKILSANASSSQQYWKQASEVSAAYARFDCFMEIWLPVRDNILKTKGWWSERSKSIKPLIKVIRAITNSQIDYNALGLLFLAATRGGDCEILAAVTSTIRNFEVPDTNRFLHHAIQVALALGNPDTLGMILSLGPKIFAPPSAPLESARRSPFRHDLFCEVCYVRGTLKDRSTWDTDVTHAFLAACSKQLGELSYDAGKAYVKHFVGRDCTPDIFNKLLRAVENIEAASEVASEGLLHASANGNEHMVKTICQSSILSKVGDQTLNRALNISCRLGHLLVAQVLLVAGADLQARVQNFVTKPGTSITLKDGSSNALEAAIVGYARFFPLPKQYWGGGFGRTSIRKSDDLLTAGSLSETHVPADHSYALSTEAEQKFVIEDLLGRLPRTDDLHDLNHAVRLATALSSGAIVDTLMRYGADPFAFGIGEETAFGVLARRKWHVSSVAKSLLTRDMLENRTAERQQIIHLALTTLSEFKIIADIPNDTKLDFNAVKHCITDGRAFVVGHLLSLWPRDSANMVELERFLQITVLSGNVRLFESLNNQMANMNAIMNMGFQAVAMSVATGEGCPDNLDLLIHLDVDINSTLDGWTPLSEACRRGNTEVVQRLLDAGAGLHSCVHRRIPGLGHAESDMHSPQTCKRMPLLGLIVEWAQPEIVRLIVKAGADVNIDTRSPSAAISTGQLFTDTPVYALLRACKTGATRVCELLLDYGADCNFVGQIPGDGISSVTRRTTALCLAAEYGHTEIVRLLLARGADVTKAVEPQGTALHTAASHSHAEVVGILLSAGAPVNNRTASGRTPLDEAALAGSTAIVEELLAAGAGIDCASHGTALSLAAFKGHVDVVRCLLMAGAEISPVIRVPALRMIQVSKRDSPFAYSNKETHYHTNALVEAFWSLWQEKVADVLLDEAIFAAESNRILQETLDALLSGGFEHEGGERQFFNRSDAVAQLLAKSSLNVDGRHLLSATHAGSDSGEIIKILLDHDLATRVNADVVTEYVKNMSSLDDTNVLSELLARSNYVSITMSLLETALHMESRSRMRRTVAALLEFDASLNLTSEHIEAILDRCHGFNRTPEKVVSLEVFLDRAKDLKVTQELLSKAKIANDLEILLKRVPSDKIQEVVPTLIFASFEEHHETALMLDVLLTYCPSLHLTDIPNLVETAMNQGDPDVLQLLLSREQALTVSAQALLNLIKSAPWPFHRPRVHSVIRVILDSGRKVNFTKELVDAVRESECFDEDLTRLLRESKAESNCSDIDLDLSPVQSHPAISV